MKNTTNDAVPKLGIDGPVIVQGSLNPVFRGLSDRNLLCSACGHVLVDRYEPRKLIGLGIECFKCKTVTTSAPWPSDEALPTNLVTCGKEGRFLIKGTVDQSGNATLASDQEIERIKKLVGVAQDQSGSIDLSAEGLENLSMEINVLTNNSMARALGETRRAFNKGNTQFTKYPPAWAMVHLERQLANGEINIVGIDGTAIAYIQWLKHAANRWRHHPLFNSVARGLVHEFHHSLTFLVIASYLSDHGNPIGFTNTDVAVGQSPDLYVNIGPATRLSIEVKAPDELHWPASVPTPERLALIIERQAKAARGQITGESGGILVLGAFHPNHGFDDMLADAVKKVVFEKQISKRFAAIASVSFSSIDVNTVHPSKLTSNAQCCVSIELNPRFPEPNPIRR